jgi:transitional endoplasmic reticulum ATPase
MAAAMPSGSANPFFLQPGDWRKIGWTLSATLVIGCLIDWVLESILHGETTAPPAAAVLLGYWPAAAGLALGCWLLRTGPFANAPVLLRKTLGLAIPILGLFAWIQFLQWSFFWLLAQYLGVPHTAPAALVLGMFGVAICAYEVKRAVFGTGIRRRLRFGSFGTYASLSSDAPSKNTPTPRYTFADVGGQEQVKEQIRQIVRNRLNPGTYRAYGVVRNGILLHGPEGTGKTFLAEATAGEFKLNFLSISPTQLMDMWVGSTERLIRDTFATARSQTPALLYIDEIDSLGARRNSGFSPGTGTRGYNDITIQLMQCIDHSRDLPGLILMASTNLLENLDPALIRDGRFDAKIRVDLPDEGGREQILKAQLERKPWQRCELRSIARHTPGYSASRLENLVNQAAAFAAEAKRKITLADLELALEESGGRDRPLVEPLRWADVVLEPELEQELRLLVRQLNGFAFGHESVPTGLLLVGPPGTGKTLIARLIASQAKRSFYPVTAADVLASVAGGSVKQVQQLFLRARQNAPSIIFIDELDGLMRRPAGIPNTHDRQVTEQFLIEISNLASEHRVFLIGATNHVEDIDPRVLRGGRFSEKLEVTLPGAEDRMRLLRRYLSLCRLDADLERLNKALAGLAPADIEAISKSAKRSAALRMEDGAKELPALTLADFSRALVRVKPEFADRLPV